MNRSKVNPLITEEYIVTEPENKYFDCKSARISLSALAPLISAFANADGGTIVIGVSDKTRKKEGINGVGTTKINEFISAPQNLCNPSPVYKEEYLDITNQNGEPDRLLLLHIEPSINQIIRTNNDSTFLRIADRTKEMRGENLRNLEYSRSTRFYEDECHPDASVADLDAQLLEKIRIKFMSKI